MSLAPNLLGCLSKIFAAPVPTPKPACKTQKMLVITQKITKKTVKQRCIQFERVPVRKKAEKIAI